jgi:hypothetical protein
MIAKIVSKGLSELVCCSRVHFVLGKLDYDFDGLVVGMHTRPADNGVFYFFIENGNESASIIK